MSLVYILSVNKWLLFMFSTLATLWVSVLWAIRFQLIRHIAVHTEMPSASKKAHRFYANQGWSQMSLLSFEREFSGSLGKGLRWSISYESICLSFHKLMGSLISILRIPTMEYFFFPVEEDVSNTMIYFITHDVICFASEMKHQLRVFTAFLSILQFSHSSYSSSRMQKKVV